MKSRESLLSYIEALKKELKNPKELEELDTIENSTELTLT